MATFSKAIISDLVTEGDNLANRGEFKISVSPVGFRRGFTIFNRELSQYFTGRAPKFRVKVNYSGEHPFNLSVFQTEPEIKAVYAQANITTSDYSAVFEVPYLNTTGKHIYIIKVSSGVDKPEKTKEIIYFNALDFDVTISRIGTVLAGAGIGSLITYLVSH